ncbi:MAG TPA: efflux RND transporter periplasmic adaptor subunit [Acidobacteriota bacterium]|nr:efflux RND transporter periplasmic adaptor subunit [Acidobacteriota bacterium]
MSRRIVIGLKITLPILVLAIAGATAASLAGMRAQPEQRASAPLPPLVRVHTVASQEHRMVVESQGTVRPRTESRVVPEVSGQVVWVAPDFVSGGFFEADSPLLRIDAHDYEQARIRARAEVAASRLRQAQAQAEAEIAVREWRDLGEGEPPALTAHVPQLENARAALAAAEANLVQAERNLERTELRAPFAGRVREKTVDVGQFVTAGAAVGSIYAIDFAEIRLPLPDDELAFLAELPLVYRGESQRLGPRVTIRADFAGRTHEWQGRLVRTEGEIDPASRMVHAVAQVRNPYGRGTDPQRPPLAVGMYVRAEIEGATANGVVLLPRSAVRVDGRVLVVDAQHRLRFRQIEILRATRDTLVVASGLRDGERVVLSALDAVTNGMVVRVEAAAAEGSRPGQTGQ